MGITIIEGNLFNTSAGIICHQCNCQGIMGSGVAAEVKKRYPEVFESYRTDFEKGMLKLGYVNFAKNKKGQIIANMCGQDHFGYDNSVYTNYDKLQMCFDSVAKYADENFDSRPVIAFPYLMSCHRGGGDWNIVYKMIEETFKNFEVQIWRLNPQQGCADMYNFNAEETKNKCIQWIRDYFEKNGQGCKAVVGISGGKDSSVTAALCVAALGKDRVFGVLMPSGEQPDIKDSYSVVEFLKIPYAEVNIGKAVAALSEATVTGLGTPLTSQTTTNLPPRIRMSTLFAVSQTVNGRVANTCNLSEDWVGYSTLFGDSAGQFAPLADLTVEEVKAVGSALGLPDFLVGKVPSDGLCGKTDEDNLGFTYSALDEYIRTGKCEDTAAKELIDKKHKANKFKLELMPKFESGIEKKIQW